MLNKLLPEEKIAIGDYMRMYGSASSNHSLRNCVSVDSYLREWADVKTNLFHLLDDQLIMTIPVKVNKPIHAITKDIQANCLAPSSKGYTFVQNFRNFLHSWEYDIDSILTDRCIETWKNKCESEMFMTYKDAFWSLYDLIDPYILTHNHFDKTTIEILTPNCKSKSITIPTGAKVIKILGKMAKAYNIEGFEEFRLAHSMCTNQKCMEGDLCLSIHPLDYLTMSDNSHSWSSCMSWKRVGDYRMGTVEMMNSPCVVVAYFKTDDVSYDINDFKWNSKRWRELFIVDEDLILGIKGYPYHSEELENIIFEKLKELAARNCGWEYYQDIQRINNYGDNLLFNDTKAVHIEIDTGFMYNDIYDNEDIRAYLNPDNIFESFSFNYSGRPICISCGDYVDNGYPDSEQAHHLTCDECQPYHRCEECGEYIDDDEIYWLDGRAFCHYCYERVADNCAGCEETYHYDDLNRVYLLLDGKYSGYEARFCRGCAADIKSYFTKSEYNWIEKNEWSSGYGLCVDLVNYDWGNHADSTYIRDLFIVDDETWEYWSVVAAPSALFETDESSI